MGFEEKTMKTEKIYEGKILNLRIDMVELPDKKYSKREIVEHPGAVAIAALTDDNEIILVKQYRKAVEKELVEIPAGMLEISEEPREAAVRELKEETGFSADKMEYICEFYTSPGFTNEKLYLFLATGLKAGESHPENDEYIDVLKFKLDNLVDMVWKGQILDSKTIIGAFAVSSYLQNKR
ncbi:MULTISPECIES: NUDIX hydrolase [Tissierellales]|jgi:ADP-ribose pyrophosphatase|uniref:NUDIX hydrolase n=1 Tax=Acidilutibacter cellobiosedens TaxID=2507161 RepID=A0A410QCF2_9FIRM|nr:MULTISPECIES: NUDIX hydrolase [Tissierellales]MBE6082063.1 NUDIX hydrolase [Tissierellaceae bacterium]QAT61742.1 NUDIX hydrolase [Acidilutibacter cellobiosedens]SCL82451.1 ADP-ribose pyrophosphatase [Sporanaerobacter sp. PP17-6a]